jgi:endoglucanase
MRFLALLAAFALAIACSQGPAADAKPIEKLPFRRCLNLANALEAPKEGEWGYTIRLEDLARIRAAGFDGVRVPVRWDQHTGPGPDHRIDPAFFARVDQVIGEALVQQLAVVLDVHHFNALNADPRGQTPKFLAIWRQIAARYKTRDQRLLFEILNEPNGALMNVAEVERLNSAALAEIRKVDPRRVVIFGGVQWNAIAGLERLTPPDDPYLAVTVHYYAPHDFTHQNASWIKDPPAGTEHGAIPTTAPQSAGTPPKPPPGRARTACRCSSASLG